MVPKACFLVFLAFATAFGADFNGIWTGTLTDRNGDPQDFSFRFTQSGGAITGKMYGDNESIPITDGKLDGDQISFVVTTELNGSIAKTLYTGTLVNGEIQLKRKRADRPDGKGDSGPRNPPVILRRL